MNSDELREQIEALRSEVRRLSDSFVSIRDEEVREAYARQVRPVLEERIDRALGHVSQEDADLRAALMDWVGDIMAAFVREGQAGGIRFLTKRSARSVAVPRTPDLDDLAGSLDAQVRSYLDIYGRALRFPRDAGPGEMPIGELPPERVERALGPLSNSLRISIMQHLAREDYGLASLSRTLGRQKGHLQFHLRSLLEGGYIEYDRKSRLYALSGRGRRALDGLARLLEELDR